VKEIEVTEYLTLEIITDRVFLTHPTGEKVVILRPSHVGEVCKALVEAAMLANQYRMTREEVTIEASAAR
jgi:hypothetical protein